MNNKFNIASSISTPKKIYPFCNKCGWRKGGQDSWNGFACKCGFTSNPIIRIEEDKDNK